MPMNRLLIVATAIGAPIAGASEVTFLTAPEATKSVADGKAWTGKRKGGETVRITINPDKTFVFDGPMTISDTWFLRGDELCLRMGLFLGDKCLRFAPNAGGFDAYEDEEFVFALTRP
jgi:hypothetical protein